MILSGFGHRLDELGGYDVDTLANLTCFAVETLEKFEASKVISGMGLGWEQALALAAIELNLPFVAAIPFEGQQKVWPEKSQELYRSLIDRAEKVKVVSSGGFTGMKFVERDKWIVNQSEGVLVLWKNWNRGEYYEEKIDRSVVKDKNGNITFTQVRDTDGILQRIVDYADEKEKAIYQLWSQWDAWNVDVGFETFRESVLNMCEGR